MNLNKRPLIRAVFGALFRYLKTSVVLSGVLVLVFLCCLPPDAPIAVASLRGSAFLAGFGLTLSGRIIREAHRSWRPKK